MSHHVYTTRAFVVASRPERERDKLLKLLTRDVGFIVASAHGVRRNDAKLKSILLDFALIEVSLIKGKHTWRVTTARLLSDNATKLRLHKTSLATLARIFNLLEKLIHGEERHPELFDDIEAGVWSLMTGKNNVESWEIFMVATILYHLGYLSKGELPRDEAEAELRKKELVKLINQGLRQSGLS